MQRLRWRYHKPTTTTKTNTVSINLASANGQCINVALISISNCYISDGVLCFLIAQIAASKSNDMVWVFGRHFNSVVMLNLFNFLKGCIGLSNGASLIYEVCTWANAVNRHDSGCYNALEWGSEPESQTLLPYLSIAHLFLSPCTFIPHQCHRNEVCNCIAQMYQRRRWRQPFSRTSEYEVLMYACNDVRSTVVYCCICIEYKHQENWKIKSKTRLSDSHNKRSNDNKPKHMSGKERNKAKC